MIFLNRRTIGLLVSAVLATSLFSGCFEPEPGRDDNLDQYDKRVGVFPLKILGLAFDGQGDLHLQVEYGHVYARSKPDDPNETPLALRNYEIRMWKWDQDDWSSTSLQNISLYPVYDSFLRGKGDNGLSTLIGEDGWVKFYSWMDGKWKNRRQWKLEDGQGGGYCGNDLGSIGFGPGGEFEQLCFSIQYSDPTPSMPNGDFLFSMDMRQEDTVRIPLWSGIRSNGAPRVSDMIFRGDTLHALVTMGKNQCWVRSLRRVKAAGTTEWESDTLGLDSNYAFQQFDPKEEAVGLVGQSADSVKWITWKNREVHGFAKSIKAGQILFDGHDCMHSASVSEDNGQSAEDTLTKDPVPQYRPQLADSFVVQYASSCGNTVDSIRYRHPTPQNALYGFRPTVFLAVNSQDQPWMALSVDMEELDRSLLFTRMPLDSLIKRWREPFRFELMKRESDGWKKVSLPF